MKLSSLISELKRLGSRWQDADVLIQVADATRPVTRIALMPSWGPYHPEPAVILHYNIEDHGRDRLTLYVGEDDSPSTSPRSCSPRPAARTVDRLVQLIRRGQPCDRCSGTGLYVPQPPYAERWKAGQHCPTCGGDGYVLPEETQAGDTQREDMP